MSVADFVAGIRGDLATRPVDQVLTDAAAEALAGARARALYATAALGDHTLRTTIAGHTATYRVESIMDARRADDLLGEARLAAWLLQGDPSGDLLWDVGSYHGHYAALAGVAGCQLRVFEPSDRNRRRAVRNLELNGVGSGHPHVTVDDRALADRAGTAWLRGPSDSELGLHDGDGGRQPVETVPGDDITELPDRVKLDVEGAEVAVLDGMAATLEHANRVLVECHSVDAVGGVGTRLREAGLETTLLPSRERSQRFIGGWRP
jgi:FkbM family methyltransferase